MIAEIMLDGFRLLVGQKPVIFAVKLEYFVTGHSSSQCEPRD
jgi:hypothetical protein